MAAGYHRLQLTGVLDRLDADLHLLHFHAAVLPAHQFTSAMIVGPKYGTQEWTDFRRELVTCSRFHDILSKPKTKAAQEAGDWSESAKKYMWEVVSATVGGQTQQGFQNQTMRRGQDKEVDAVDHYLKSTFHFEHSEGRILRIDDTIIGGTPDWFIDDDPDGPGTLQVKCPDMHNYLRLWDEHHDALEAGLQPGIPSEYYEQAHGEIWISERAWCDFVHFDDRFPIQMRMFVVRVMRDEEYLETVLKPKVFSFAEMVQLKVEKVRSRIGSMGPERKARFIADLTNENNLFADL